MSATVNIESTTDYDKFKFLNVNRTILPHHVERISKDPCFIEKYKYSPIIVDKDFCIIDGQHRYEAAKSLGLPIFYIQDKEANFNDIKVRNTLQVSWKQHDYVEFYRRSNPDCQFLYDLHVTYGCSYSFLFAAIEKFFSKMSGRGRCYTYLKEGKFSLDHNRDRFKEFVETVSQKLKQIQTSKGYESMRPFLKNVVTSAFAHYFLTNRPLFDRIIQKMAKTSFPMPFCGTYETARETLARLANHKETKVSKPILPSKRFEY